ncbi:MAG: NUDIX domain-containing protein [Candidatus Paceibacterota bacterium]|jgi:ADP-ribose pyrophosphatase YjhB (NUDIX family)|nr:NUDIX domain-containing protein [Candidatus Paceibacterota bacterium]MDD5621443.1 NUDIX domain-containing protein [Candidatus Paceibacterota bacterium]
MKNINLHPEVVVGIFLKNKKGEIALFKSKKWNNFWWTVGGHVEYGELLIKAAQRETREEAGIDVKELQLIYSGELINSDVFFRESHFIYFYYLAFIDEENLKIDNKEILEYKWFSIEEIYSMENVHNHLLEVIDRINKL